MENNKPTYNQKISQELNKYKKLPVIYKITSPSGKVYIGQSVNFPCRYIRYRSLNILDQYKLYCSLSYHGFDNHIFEIIHLASSKEELDEMEIFYIKKFNSCDNGLNSTHGGKFAKLTDNQKNRVRRRLAGKKPTEETKDKIRAFFEKNGYPMQGKNHSEETKKKLSETHKKIGHMPPMHAILKSAERNRGKKLSQDRLDIIVMGKTKSYFRLLNSNGLSEKNIVFSRPMNQHRNFVLVRNKQTGFDSVFQSNKVASEALKICYNNISALRNGKVESYKGYTAKGIIMYY